MAIMHSPPLLIAGEPTSALDAMTQMDVLRLLKMLNRERGMAILYISHDLQSLVSLCHRVAVLRSGTIVELGETISVVRNPQHSYTENLLSCAAWLEYWLQRSERSAPPVQTPISLVHPYTGLKSPSHLPM
jgi:peptide/nickel transport system ATP-binding protein/peptide/nickel transport system permease protein